MMGTSHVVSGLCVGMAAAPALGVHEPARVGLVAGIVGVCALIPDLDCQGSEMTRMLGPVGWVLCRVLRNCSRVLYAVTKGPRDERGTGTHRHASHTLLFAVLLGGATWAGLLVGHVALPLSARTVGLAVALGCFVHCLGDSLTVSGCPWLFPLPMAGETWYEIKLLGPLSFVTGSRPERWLVRPAFAVGAFLATPGVWPLVVHRSCRV